MVHSLSITNRVILILISVQLKSYKVLFLLALSCCPAVVRWSCRAGHTQIQHQHAAAKNNTDREQKTHICLTLIWNKEIQIWQPESPQLQTGELLHCQFLIKVISVLAPLQLGEGLLAPTFMSTSLFFSSVSQQHPLCQSDVATQWFLSFKISSPFPPNILLSCLQSTTFDLTLC